VIGLINSVALLLILNFVAGLLRVWWGPSAADRMLAAQLFSTTGTAVLLLLSKGLSNPALQDVALVSALLAAVSTVVFVRRWAFSSKQNISHFDEHY
jgi:multicomponent Na+:H+ antiporter subunit F